MSRGQHCKHTRTGMGVAAIATGSAFAVAPMVFTGTAASPSMHQDVTHAATNAATASDYVTETGANIRTLADAGGRFSPPIAVSLASDVTHLVPTKHQADDSGSGLGDQDTSNSNPLSDSLSTGYQTCGGAHQEHGKHHTGGKHHKRKNHHRHSTQCGARGALADSVAATPDNLLGDNTDPEAKTHRHNKSDHSNP